MKKLLILIILVAGLGGAFAFTKWSNAAKLQGVVNDLAEFTLPTDPYHDIVKKEFTDKVTGKKVMLDVDEPWQFDHEPKLKVRAAWAQREEGALPLLLACIADTTKPAAQRIGAMLAVGNYRRAPKEARKQIIDTLVAQLANTGDRIAEFAAFSLGVFGKKDVDAAVAAAAAKASDESRYYCLIALRDNRVTMDPNSPFSTEAGATMLAALDDKHGPSRKLAAVEAHNIQGDAQETAALVTKLLALLKDPDASISDAARTSIQQKVAELAPGGPEFNALREGAKAVYESKQIHTRANAVWVTTYCNDQAEDAKKIGADIKKDYDVIEMAWSNDLDKNPIKAAVAAGYGRHGTLELQLKVAKFLLEDDLTPEVADGIFVGLGRASANVKDAKLVAVLLEAAGKDNLGAGTAGRLMAIHGSKREHAAALIDAYEAAKDATAKAGLLEGAQALVDDQQADTVKKLKDALNKKKW